MPDLVKEAPMVGLEPSMPATAASMLDRLNGVEGANIDLTTRKIDPEVVRRTASALGLSRPEARKVLTGAGKELRQALAAGARYPLPVVIERSGPIHAVEPMEAGRAVLQAIERSGGVLTVDVETTGYPIGHRYYALRTVQLGDKYVAAEFRPVEDAAIIRALIAYAPVLEAHSSPADIIPLAHAGLGDEDAMWAKMRDTVIKAKLGDPKSTGADPALKRISAHILGPGAVSTAATEGRKELFKQNGWLMETQFDTPWERSGWAQVDSECETMLRYAAADVLDTAAIGEVLEERTPVAPNILARERLAMRVTARATSAGVALNRDLVAELDSRHRLARSGHGAVLMAQWGVENPGSTKELVGRFQALGAVLPNTKPTKTKPEGGPSTATGVIAPFVDVGGELGAFADEVLKWRHHNTAVTLFTNPYRALCELGDGRARPTVYTLGTDTGRMSCVRPNMQQLPRAGGMRAMIVADPGYVMISADFASVELRVAAALSGDRTLSNLILAGEDLHWQIARLVYGPDATKAHRYKVKRGVFGRIYGGGLDTLAEQMGVFPTVAQQMIDVMDGMLPELSAWSNTMRQGVRRGKDKFHTYSGRVIHLAESPHKAPNYAIQGSARELLVDALVRWQDTRWSSCVLLPVHDELDVFVPAQDAEEATAALVACMASTLGPIPIVAEAAKPSVFWRDSE